MKLFGKDTDKDLVIIAEIGVNHQGDFEEAKKLLDLAATTGADAVKFQSYTPARFISADTPERLDRVTRFGLTEEQFKELSERAKEKGLTFISTPVTEDWVERLDAYCPVFKIASGDVDFEPVIRAAAQTGKPVIISTGTATEEEVAQAISWVREEVGAENLKDRLAILHCVSAYPTPMDQANVQSVAYLKDKFGLTTGYSNHVIGTDACLAAVALGAQIIEVHFTDKKTDRDFHDHTLSFEPEDVRQFIEMANNIRASLGAYTKQPLECEGNVKNFRKGVVAARDLEVGTTLSEQDLMFARPGTQFLSGEVNQLIGKTLTKPFKAGESLTRDGVEGVRQEAA